MIESARSSTLVMNFTNAPTPTTIAPHLSVVVDVTVLHQKTVGHDAPPVNRHSGLDK